MVERVEDTLNGGYSGLYGEVVTEDCYRIRQLDFDPEFVIDLGANVGIFARFAQSRFPMAKIICVEPDAENFAYLAKFTDGCVLLNAAIGNGPVRRIPHSINGAHEVYASVSPGFEGIEKFTAHDIRVVHLRDVLRAFCVAGPKMLKMDIEGNEINIFNDPKEMEVLRQIDYMAFELHDHLFGSNVKEIYHSALSSLNETHNSHREGFFFWARKKKG